MAVCCSGGPSDRVQADSVLHQFQDCTSDLPPLDDHTDSLDSVPACASPVPARKQSTRVVESEIRYLPRLDSICRFAFCYGGEDVSNLVRRVTVLGRGD